MEVQRITVAEQIEIMLAGKKSKEDTGWWAYDMLLQDSLTYEPGYERLLEDVLRSLSHFHDTEPIMQQFYPDSSEIIYYLKCLKGEETYQRFMVIHWVV